MKKLKALNILDDKGFWPEKAAVADAVREVLALGQCREPLPVRDYGRYRDPQWRDDKNKLVPWRTGLLSQKVSGLIFLRKSMNSLPTSPCF